ncbi:hypothetical protein [Capnocytophaga canimorsus]|uniref:hypothetical protein n=1 Tax=Capnocytophaga canimorsus TaxID=28188 RepID=UPI0028EC21F5|nr:hypothetical protein [Capnocytophaga canimorsus]MDT9500576.1 hypothetical protein [Capnocytophaga canimorsus]
MKTIEQIYQSLVSNINNAIEEDWSKAVVNIKTVGEMASFKGFYLNKDNLQNQIEVDDFDFDLLFDILDLHKITTEGGNNQWNKAIFTLFPDGNFDMEFIWDQAWHDEIVRLSKS